MQFIFKILDKYHHVFGKEIEERQNEAKKSILVAVDDKQAAQSLYAYAKTIGAVRACFLYSLSNRQVRCEILNTETFTSQFYLL